MLFWLYPVWDLWDVLTDRHWSSLQDNIPDNVISLVQPYIDNEEFQPASIAKVSKACTSICQWVRAMHAYHFVAKAVKPKRVTC